MCTSHSALSHCTTITYVQSASMPDLPMLTHMLSPCSSLQGQLPCNAPFLRARALQLIALDASFPDMRFRTLLSSHSATLAHPPELLGDRARRLQRLLPHQDTTTVMATVMEHMTASADVLALWLCELELPFQEVFKMGVPPAVFSYCYSQAAATATSLPGRRGRQATSTTAEEVFPTCDVLQILARCEVLRELVGPESGYTALCRHAALLDVAPDQMRANVRSLRECLSLHEGVELCRVVEGAPALLALPEGVAVQRAEELQEVLGWSDTGVRALVIARSQVLLVETDVAARKLLLVREASAAGGVAGRGPWCLELLGGQGEVDAMARVLLSGWEVLSRVQYLAQRPAERGGMRATEVLGESRQAFARAVPRYSRWWVENGRQLVDELGFEEGEFTRDGGGGIEEKGGGGRADVGDVSHEDRESQVMEEERLRWNGQADKQSNGVDSRLAGSTRPVQHNRSQSASNRHAPWEGVGRSRWGQAV